jgi:AraC-like DNA-binding protein
MNNNYKTDHHFILHQPFFHEGVQSYNELIYASPYQAVYYEFKTSKNPESQTVTYIPNGCMELLFIQDATGNHIEVLGSGTEAKQISRIPGANYFGVRLKPGMFLSYPGFSLKGLANQMVFLETAPAEFDKFFDKLAKTDMLNRKVELFHKYFDAYIDISEVNTLTGYMLSEINASQGNVRVYELADELHYSERHISRIFLDSMGIPPKTFARIVRFQNVMDAILHQPMLSLCDYISELGYSDQAHFQREFKQYTGITPRHFLTYIQECGYSFRCAVPEEQQQAS